ncbi:hypothetical protein ADEAN_000076700 [Angomonas deanei]|uniref:Uncharacterized protein n=1 Tax=Angomonas deanei TaxID=59799 RepID=A0A7G2C116_9TRYP|nr:hypothetical protein ADEAN_000076700 [Angomonas deanei]
MSRLRNIARQALRPFRPSHPNVLDSDRVTSDVWYANNYMYLNGWMPGSEGAVMIDSEKKFSLAEAFVNAFVDSFNAVFSVVLLLLLYVFYAG